MARPLSETVKELRERRGWTMGQLAAYADVTTGYISKLEAGKVAAPAIDVLQRLARALKVDVRALIEGDVAKSDPVDLLRQALTTLEQRSKIDLNDPELEAMLKEVGGDLDDAERAGVKEWLRHAKERRDRRNGERQS